ncbi:ABC-type transport system, permease and ATPase component [Pyrenophora tritici-repentis]|nr:ABC-type transport system, permease and ATPase component [Pyrenophora tritici-repentis]
MPPVRSKRSAEAHKVAPKRAKTAQGTASQPIPVEATPPEIPIHTSPRKALAIAASQATDEHPFERQLLYLLLENAIAAPTKSSNAATNAPTEVLEVVNSGDEGSDGGLDSHLADDFAGIVWDQLPGYLLKPLKEATRSLKARGTLGSFGAIYEVYLVYEAVLKAYETALKPYGGVNHNEVHSLEDHLVINLRAAWHKLDRYYLLLDDSPAYYAACCLYLYYKSCCEKSWRDKPSWIRAGEARLQQLWAQYRRPLAPLARTLAPRTSSIRDAIAAMVNTEQTAEVVGVDQLERWRRFELP